MKSNSLILELSITDYQKTIEFNRDSRVLHRVPARAGGISVSILRRISDNDRLNR